MFTMFTDGLHTVRASFVFRFVEATAFRSRVHFNAPQMPPLMINHQAVLLAEGTRMPTVSTIYGDWVEDVGSADTEILGGLVNRAD
jgi:hypothetical protein